MAIMEISIFPIGTGSTSISDHVTEAIRVIQKEKRLKYRLTSMGTMVESDLDRLLSLARKMHRTVLKGQVKRIITSITIDERRDRELTIDGKIESVRQKL